MAISSGLVTRERNYKMRAYTHAGLEATGMSWSINDQEMQKLKASKLWPCLIIIIGFEQSLKEDGGQASCWSWNVIAHKDLHKCININNVRPSFELFAYF